MFLPAKNSDPYWEKLCPRSWVRPRAVLRPRAQFLTIRTDPRRWITFLFFFQLRFKSFRKMSLHSPTYVCWSRTRSCWWRTNEAGDRLQTKTKHYNMIFSSVIYIMTLTALFYNKERFLCLARQFIIWMSNKDKRIDELDIKSARKKIQQWFSSAERLVQSSGMKTAQMLCKKS